MKKTFEFDVEKMENSPLRQAVKEKTKKLDNKKNDDILLNLVYTEYKPSVYKNTKFSIPSIKNGYARISNYEFRRVAEQLTAWGVPSSGAVIAREGATFVKSAVDITLANIEKANNIANIKKIDSPKAYFRGVLKKLQEYGAKGLAC